MSQSTLFVCKRSMKIILYETVDVSHFKFFIVDLKAMIELGYEFSHFYMQHIELNFVINHIIKVTVC